MFVHPCPPSEDLYRIYDEQYFGRGNKYFGSPQTDCRSHNSANEDRRAALVKAHKSGGRLLDVGCATGGFLQAAARAGFAVQGIEISDFCVDYVKTHSTFDVFKGNLVSARFPEQSYDGVTLWDVLEHLRNPREVLDEIHRILRPGGILCLSTGDHASFLARVTGRFWHLLTPPQHLFFFSRRSVRILLEQHGFIVRQIVYAGRTTTLDFVLFKGRESFGKIVKPIQAAARLLKVGSVNLYVNTRDIMTCVAEKGPLR